MLVICRQSGRVSIDRLCCILNEGQDIIEPIVVMLCKDGDLRAVGVKSYAFVPEAGIDRLLAYWPLPLTAKIRG